MRVTSRLALYIYCTQDSLRQLEQHDRHQERTPVIGHQEFYLAFAYYSLALNCVLVFEKHTTVTHFT